MANDRIMVTVTVPEGLRAIVETKDRKEHVLGYGPPVEFTVTGGTSMDFFVDGIRSLNIKEGLQHCTTGALDRKPDSE